MKVNSFHFLPLNDISDRQRCLSLLILQDNVRDNALISMLAKSAQLNAKFKCDVGHK